jgi:ankyrin repeat protein
LTPFHLAAATVKDCDILNLLLANEKVDINETTSQLVTALHIASFASNLIAVDFLLSNGANPNAADRNGATPLHWAARYAKDMDIVDLLLNHEDLDVNLMDKDGSSALDYARLNNNGNGKSIANLLKEKGAVKSEIKLKQSGSRKFFKKQMRDFSNRKPDEIENFLNDDAVPIKDKVSRISESEEYLLTAIKDSNVENVRILLKNGADISACCAAGEKGTNALHMASNYAKTTELIDVVRETGEFDINGVDNNGWTALHYAIGGTNYVINARYLLEKGADPTIADKEGSTPLHMAASRAKEIETISLILTDNKQVDSNHRNVYGETALHVAIKAKNVITARYLLESGADPTIRDNKGLTPFHLAAKLLTDTHVLGLMLKNEKNMNMPIDEKSNDGATALYLAMTTSNLIVANFLLSNGADPNAADVNGLTPLHLAVKYAKDMGVVELLLNHPDVNVNCLDMKGNNALHFTKMNLHGHGERIAKLLKEKGVISQTGDYLNTKKFFKSEEIVKRVLQVVVEENWNAGEVNFVLHMGADLSTVTFGEGKMNALCMASARAKKTKILDIILETGQFDINGRNILNGATALHFALYAKNMITARYLLERGADLTISDKDGLTPFHLAAYYATTTDIISLILKRYLVDINCRDVNGTTALHYAIRAENVDIARYLLENGANPFNRDHTGETPFHLAAQHLTDNDILGLMLTNEKKIDIEESDQEGSTALHVAMMYSNLNAADFLLSKGANPNAADKYGSTPLHLAAWYAKDMDIVELLLIHKDVDVNLLDNKGYSALDYAIDNEHGLSEEIANLLMGKRAAKT